MPLSMDALALYTWLSLQADDEGVVRTSRALLCEQTGLSERQVRTSLEKLVATKLATKQTTKLPTKFATTITISFLSSCKPQKTKSDQVNDQVNDQVSRAYKNDNIIISCLKEEDKERDSSLRSESLSSDDDDAISKAHDVGEELSKFFNQLVAEQSSVMPKVRAVGGDRRKMLMARVKQYGVEAVKEAFVKATTSSFLNGQNGRGFTASFDWIIRPNNFLKVLEGNYDNKNNPNTHHATTPNPQQPYHDSDHPTTEQLRQQTAAYIASRLAQD